MDRLTSVVPLATIPQDLVEFVESGVSVLVGTRDADLRPRASRAGAASVSKDRREVTIYMTDSWKGALEDIAQNGEIAVNFTRPYDNHAVQLKGKVVRVAPPSETPRDLVERYLAAYAEQLYIVGIPRSLTKRLVVWPAVGVTFEVREMYVQTPGVDAGKPLEPRR
jgi:hypothetical protein